MSTRDERHTQFLTSIRAKIDEHGHTVAAIEGDPITRSPRYTYTIGLTGKYGYELAMSGADVPDMQNALNKIARRVRERKLTPHDGLLVEGVLENGYLLRLKRADPSWAFRWIADALELPEQPPVWQVQFPARDGRWPGEPGYDPAPYAQEDFTLPAPSTDGGD